MAQASTNHDIKVLNALIETTLDSADGYRQAADNAGNSQYKILFQQWSVERRKVAGDLQNEVRSLGGKAEDDGSILAAAHRTFLKLRDSVTGDDQSVVNEVERGEDFIKAKYEEALKDGELSTTARDAVGRAFSSVRSGHDQARDLKRSLKSH
ncbi:MAG: PA2169 family four-helix-bundle protein [Steroidobacteraceae bacterium]